MKPVCMASWNVSGNVCLTSVSVGSVFDGALTARFNTPLQSAVIHTNRNLSISCQSKCSFRRFMCKLWIIRYIIYIYISML